MDGPSEPERSRDLVQRATGGDQAAVELLLAEHLSRLRAFLRLRMGAVVRSKESTEDLVQSVCREALERLDGFEYRGEASFRHWLFRQAEHKVIDRGRFYRRGKRDAEREIALEAQGHESETLRGLESLFTPSRDAVAHEELARLEQAFGKLPPDYQEVILLARVVELPHAKIAERMGRTVSATWTLLSRALARLSTHLDPG
ncbi:MAG: RNA polymerase sigma factor [Planctomycetota bacterium]